MRILFYGTPAVAVPYLELACSRATVVAAVAQPDKPVGRGLKLEAGPVKKRAAQLGIPVLQPAKSSQVAEAVQGASPDLAVVVAYGKILRPDALAVPRLGTLNVHFSLLPKYRGAAPVQWSLVRGEARTGVTLFWLDEGMDTGPVFLKKETDVGPDEDAPALMARLRDLGLEALREALAEIEAGRIKREPQSGEASLAPLIKKEDAKIFLSRPAADIHNLVRGMALWPKAFLELSLPSGTLRVQVLKTSLHLDRSKDSSPPGTILKVGRERGFLVQCGDGSSLWLLAVQPEGKKPVSAGDFLNGLRLGAGDFLPAS